MRQQSGIPFHQLLRHPQGVLPLFQLQGQQALVLPRREQQPGGVLAPQVGDGLEVKFFQGKPQGGPLLGDIHHAAFAPRQGTGGDM